jgi:hypothetical protein
MKPHETGTDNPIDFPVVNTDKEIWREIPGDYYSPSIHVTEQNTIGINVCGVVYVKSIEEWHRLAGQVPCQPKCE